MRSALEVFSNTTNASFNTPAGQCDQGVLITMHANGTTGMTGTAQLQVSLDSLRTVPAQVSNWVNLGSALSVSGTSVLGTGKLDLNHMWFRVVYTYAAGTGTVTIAVKTSGV